MSEWASGRECDVRNGFVYVERGGPLRARHGTALAVARGATATKSRTTLPHTAFPAGFNYLLLIQSSLLFLSVFTFYCDFQIVRQLHYLILVIILKLLTDKIISKCVPRVICVRVYVMKCVGIALCSMLNLDTIHQTIEIVYNFYI